MNSLKIQWNHLMCKDTFFVIVLRFSCFVSIDTVPSNELICDIYIYIYMMTDIESNFAGGFIQTYWMIFISSWESYNKMRHHATAQKYSVCEWDTHVCPQSTPPCKLCANCVINASHVIANLSVLLLRRWCFQAWCNKKKFHYTVYATYTLCYYYTIGKSADLIQSTRSKKGLVSLVMDFWTTEQVVYCWNTLS
jgi:hypothetical protein